MAKFVVKQKKKKKYVTKFEKRSKIHAAVLGRSYVDVVV